MNKEVAHYVVTAQPPGSVLATAKCNFMAPHSKDVLVAKSRRLEVRQLRLEGGGSGGGGVAAAGNHNNSSSNAAKDAAANEETTTSTASPFPVVLTVPINGRITNLWPLRIPNSPTSFVFFLTERLRYAVVSYNDNLPQQQSQQSPHPIQTHASGSLSGMDQNVLGRLAESGPLVAVDHYSRCIALHLYDGLITILPVHLDYTPPSSTTTSTTATASAKDDHGDGEMGHQKKKNRASAATPPHRRPLLGQPFHCRIEERTVLALTFLWTTANNSNNNNDDDLSSSTTPTPTTTAMPTLCVLHQGARGEQHMTSMVVNLPQGQLHLHGSQSVPPSTVWLKKSLVDGGSSLLIPVPPPPRSSPPVAAAAAAATATSHAVPLHHHAHSSPTSSSSSSSYSLGGVIIVGQQQLTYCSPTVTKILPVPQALFLTADELPGEDGGGGSLPRYLLGDEFGNLHLLTLFCSNNNSTTTNEAAAAGAATGGMQYGGGGAYGSSGGSGSPTTTTTSKVVALQRETLGSCGALSSSLAYLEQGLVFCGSSLGDSQLIQIHDEPIPLLPAPAAGAAGGAVDTAGSSSDAAMMHQDSASTNDAAGGVLAADTTNTTNTTTALMDSTYLSIVEEYTQLGPILDFDLIPTTLGGSSSSGQPNSSSNHKSDSNNNNNNGPVQCQVVTASGSSQSGSIRLIRNGIGMNESAAVEMPGIQNMWSVRKSYAAADDTYLVQSFVGETRVLGVATTASAKNDDEEQMMMMMDADTTNENNNEEEEEEEVGGTLEEVFLPGLDSAASTLYAGNIYPGDGLLQITETQVRLFAHDDNSIGGGENILDSWSSSTGQAITVAAANEAGQIALCLQGGTLVYLAVQQQQEGDDDNDKIQQIGQRQMDREVSCVDLHPLVQSMAEGGGTSAADAMTSSTAMELDDDNNNNRRPPAHKSELLAVGLWDDFTVRLFNLDASLDEALCIHLSTEDDDDEDDDAAGGMADSGGGGPSSRRSRHNMMARSLSLVTLDLASSSSSTPSSTASGGGAGSFAASQQQQGVDMLFVGLGDGTLISFAVVKNKGVVSVHSKKEVCLGTQRIDLVPLSTERGGTCVLATGDRPTVVYLAGLGGTSLNQSNPKLCYSNVNLAASTEEETDDVSRLPAQQSIAVNVASPFFSPLLFDAASLGSQHYSLCVADDSHLRLGVIDDIQKLHVTTCRLGMAPRRIVHCPDGRFFAVGCIESGIKHFGLGDDEANMGNCIRFMDDTTFDDLERVDLEPFEIILSMVYATLRVVPSAGGGESSVSEKNHSAAAGGGGTEKPFLLVGTAYALANEDEPTRGRILVYTCLPDETDATSSNDSRAVRQVTEFSTTGGVYSLCQFYNGMVMCTVNSKTMLCQLTEDAGMIRLEYVGRGHHGNILSLFVKSRTARRNLDLVPAGGSGGTTGGGGTTAADRSLAAMDVSDDAAAAAVTKRNEEKERKEEQFAIVGDLMRSISLVQYYPEHKTLEEVARDFNGNWTTAIEMLHENVYLGAENWNNLFCLRRNTTSSSEEVRCRLDTIGEFHLGEMCNKFMRGSLVMPVSSSSNSQKVAAAARTGMNRSNSSAGGGQQQQQRVRSPSPQKKKLSSSSSAAAEPSSPGKAASATTRMRRPVVVTGSQTLFGTVDGTLGVILGMDGKTTVFFTCLERAMAKVIKPVGDLDHAMFRAVKAEQRIHPQHGFCDGDLVESFLDLDHANMLAVVREMNRDGGWQVGEDDEMLLGAATSSASATAATSSSSSAAARDGGDKDDDDAVGLHERAELSVDEVVAMVEEMTMLH